MKAGGGFDKPGVACQNLEQYDDVKLNIRARRLRLSDETAWPGYINKNRTNQQGVCLILAGKKTGMRERVPTEM